MSTVFVTQENPKLDYAPAERFGDVRFITKREWSSIRGSINNQELLREIKAALATFNPDTDYFVITGSPVVAALVFIVYGQLRLPLAPMALRWSNRDRVYQPVTLGL